MSSVRPAVAVLALAVLAAVALWRSAPPRPCGLETPAAEFSAARADEVLRRLVGDQAPRPPGSAAHERFRERLKGELARLGLTARLQEGTACDPSGSCAVLTNVVAELPGATPGPAVLLVAHYDSVGAGPGVSDDASGAACLLEVARALLASPRRAPVLLLFDDGEEAGLLGAELFMASELSSRVGAVVNLEARGTSGASVMFETSRDNACLVRRAVSRMPRPVTSSVFSFVYDRLPNDTDLTVFKREGLPGLNLAFIGSAARYHTREDSLTNLSRASLQHQGENALALVRALADADLSSPPGGGAVFFDLLGLAILWWPRGATPVLALLALVLVRASCVRRGGRLLPGWKAALPVLAPVVGTLAAAAVWQLLRLAGAFPVTFVAHPWPAVVAAAAAALSAALPVLAAEARWTGSPAQGWERAWTSVALLGLVLAVTVPEVSFLLVVPALAAGVSRLVLPEAASVWVPSALLGVLLLPLALRMPDALGPVGLAIVALALVLTLASLPLEPSPGAARGSAVTLAGLCILASVAALLVPKTTPANPEHGSMLVAEEEGAGAATLFFSPESDRLPVGVAAAARFETRTETLPWGPRGPVFAAPLPSLGQPFPTLEVVEEQARPDGARRVVLRLVSCRGAPTVGLAVAGETAMGSVRVEGRPLPPPYLRGHRSVTGPTRISCRATPPEGVVVELTLLGARREGLVFDQSPGLPDSAAAIGSSRSAFVAPANGGDVTVLYRKVSL